MNMSHFKLQTFARASVGVETLKLQVEVVLGDESGESKL
jgi:hypothetical protein